MPLARSPPGEDAGPSAELQRRVRQELLERLQFFALEPRLLLDLGAGACEASAALKRRFPAARVLAIDSVRTQLKAAPRAWWPSRRFVRVCARAERLPLPDHRAQIVYSSLMLSAHDRFAALLPELARVLEPGGLLLFSILATGTAPELLAGALVHAGFAEPVLDVEQYRLLDMASSCEVLFGAAFASGSGPLPHAPPAARGESTVSVSALRRSRPAP